MTFCLCYQILKNLHYKNLEEFRKNEAHYILKVVPGTLFLEQNSTPGKKILILPQPFLFSKLGVSESIRKKLFAKNLLTLIE